MAMPSHTNRKLLAATCRNWTRCCRWASRRQRLQCRVCGRSVAALQWARSAKSSRTAKLWRAVVRPRRRPVKRPFGP